MSLLTTDRRAILDELATLSGYPAEGWLECLSTTTCHLRIASPEAALELERTRSELAARTPGELEELYTRTFDMTPEQTLDLGWHLHGETYKRGAFLVELRQKATALGVDPGVELPDHMPTFLRLVARADEAEAARLAPQAHPAIAAIRKALDAQANPLRGLVAAIGVVLGAPAVSAAPEPQATAPSACGSARTEA